MMKIIILTTQTSHHAYFIQELSKAFPIELIVTETGFIHPPFSVHHPFEEKRDDYETRELFNGRVLPLGEFAKNIEFPEVNDASVVATLHKTKPDVIIVFGTRRLSKDIIASCPEGIINLHGGDPEEYRGLDSHLWAIYHNQFNSLITTLHRVNPLIDDGDIILQAPVEIYHKMPLYKFRKNNTDICIRLVISALDMYNRLGTFLSRKQTRKGRYYSFMPRDLKDICLQNFKKHTNSL